MFYILDCDMNIDPIVPSFVTTAINILKVVIPIILIVMGMIDLAKAVMSGDDKVVKESTTKLIKRIVYALLVFFIVAIVQFVFGLLEKASTDSEHDDNNFTSCISCFVNYEQGCVSFDGD